MPPGLPLDPRGRSRSNVRVAFLSTFPYLAVPTLSDTHRVINCRTQKAVDSSPDLLYLLERLNTRTERIDAIRRFGITEQALDALVSAGFLVEQRGLEGDTAARDHGVRVGIVCTLRGARPAEVLSFVHFHRSIGFKEIFLYFDDADDPCLTVAEGLEGVHAFPHDDELRARQREMTVYRGLERHLVPGDANFVMSKQILNTELALAEATRVGLDWLLHIDIDELFYTVRSMQGFFAGVPDNVGEVRFFSYEAAPEKARFDNIFDEITLFKRNPAFLSKDRTSKTLAALGREFHFLGHSRGKAAVRVLPGARPHGVHGFVPPAESPLHIRPALDPSILHYINCDFRNFARKYAQRGNFGDRFFGGVKIEERVPFHLRARDWSQTLSREELFEQYCRTVVYGDDAQVLALLESDLCLRIEGPSRRIRGESGPAPLTIRI